MTALLFMVVFHKVCPAAKELWLVVVPYEILMSLVEQPLPPVPATIVVAPVSVQSAAFVQDSVQDAAPPPAAV